MAPLEVRAEPGTLFHAVYPAPTFTQWTGNLAVELILKAVAQAMPDRVSACSGGDVPGFMMVGTHPDTGELYAISNNDAVGWGATALHDGAGPRNHPCQTVARNTPMEVLEARSGMRFERLEIRADSGGAGRFRGGCGLRRDIVFDADGEFLSVIKKTSRARGRSPAAASPTPAGDRLRRQRGRAGHQHRAHRRPRRRSGAAADRRRWRTRRPGHPRPGGDPPRRARGLRHGDHDPTPIDDRGEPMKQPRDLVLTGATVIDGTGGPPLDGAAIRVTDGRIAGVGDADGVLADARRDGVDEVIELAGAFVTSGLINTHTHLSLGLPGALGAALDRMTAHELVLYMADGARRTLEAGVTTVRCVAERDGADFALRRAIEAGRAIGPRIFTAGRALVCTGGHGHGHGDTRECDGPAEFRKGARREISLGADLIKVMISGGIAGEHEGWTRRSCSPTSSKR